MVSRSYSLISSDSPNHLTLVEPGDITVGGVQASEEDTSMCDVVANNKHATSRLIVSALGVDSVNSVA